MTADWAAVGIGELRRLRVRCDDPKCPRPLDKMVGTSAHAMNLAAKHNREHHTGDNAQPPATDSYNVSAAARAYLAAVRTVRTTDRGDHLIYAQAQASATAAEEVWHALTGLTGRAALEAAEHAAAHVVTAHAVPF